MKMEQTAYRIFVFILLSLSLSITSAKSAESPQDFLRKTAKADWVFIGLGCGGDEPRYNVARMAMDAIAEKLDPPQSAFTESPDLSFVTLGDGQKVLLVKSYWRVEKNDALLTSLKQWMEGHGIPSNRVVVFHPEMTLAVGEYDIQCNDQSHTHFKHSYHFFNIDTPRVRIGIGPKPDGVKKKDFAHSPFTEAELIQWKAARDHLVTNVGEILGTINVHKPLEAPAAKTDGTFATLGAERSSEARYDWMFVGLGNPGEQYSLNLHNAGFIAIDAIATNFGSSQIAPRSGLELKSAHLYSGKRILLVKPQTYMNLSGQNLESLLNCYKIPSNRVVVFHDEMYSELGRFSLCHGGLPAGVKGLHNGVQSLEAPLGLNYWRMRIGIGSPGSGVNKAAYVLSNFDDVGLKAVEAGLRRFSSKIDAVLDKINLANIAVTTAETSLDEP